MENKSDRSNNGGARYRVTFNEAASVLVEGAVAQMNEAIEPHLTNRIIHAIGQMGFKKDAGLKVVSSQKGPEGSLICDVDVNKAGVDLLNQWAFASNPATTPCEILHRIIADDFDSNDSLWFCSGASVVSVEPAPTA